MVVDCYFNYRKKCFSVRYRGKVIGHRKFVILSSAEFKVNQNGRERVVRTKSKNVHAIVRGTLSDRLPIGEYREGYYNPYKTETFIDKETGRPLGVADVVVLDNLKIYYKW